jgi:hypothetical protein
MPLVNDRTLGIIKKEERAKGERRAREAFEAEAKAAGFSSYEEMKAAAAAAKRGRPAETRQQPQARTEEREQRTQPQGNGSASGGVSRREFERLQRENTELQEKVRGATRDKMRAEKRLREFTRESLEEQARLELKFDAMAAGIKDSESADYAVSVIRKRLPVRTEGEDVKAYHARLAAVDQRKFFADMRESHPYLFGEVRQPASTGNGGSIPQQKSPGAAAKPQNDAGTPPAPTVPNGKSARDWTPEQLNKSLTDMGIDPNVLS